MYQSELRKPVHIVFCLDYSGSMYGEGNTELVKAMKYILTEEEAEKNMLQFSSKDKISVIAFDHNIMGVWETQNGIETTDLIDEIEKTDTRGSTNIYLASTNALDMLSQEDSDTYNLSIILMTDGLSNCGSINELEKAYNRIGKDIPIYSIMFGYADPEQLEDIANLTNAKVFDGRTDLLSAFKQVRGYN